MRTAENYSYNPGQKITVLELDYCILLSNLQILQIPTEGRYYLQICTEDILF